MEIFTKKNLILKIVIALVIVILFNFSAPTISQAAEGIGGTLLSPILDFVVAIGDALINVVQSILFGMDNSLVKVSTDSNDIFDIVSNILIGGLAIAVGILVPGVGAGIIAGLGTFVAGQYVGNVVQEATLPETFYLPIFAISPEEIFQNRIALLDVNFFNPNEYEDINGNATGNTGVQGNSTAANLQGTIASWYIALRNLALIILLSVLLYIGIRILTSSIAQDKAKYKEKLWNWIIAICILCFMHYIMAFATTMVEAISEGINVVNKPIIAKFPDLSDYYIVVQEHENPDDPNSELVDKKIDAQSFFQENDFISQEDGSYLWPTNLMGTIRLEMQWEEGSNDDNILLRKVGYTIMYLVLVFYTIGFLLMYVKRLIMLAFLTMIAPLVAMTYPLDKMHDGNAQAFNMWLKEYILNLLIQPLHLILYTMLVGSAINMAADAGSEEPINMIYAIVALGFIMQAEKIMRKFFGFDKSSTLEGGGTAALGGALAMAGISQVKHLIGKGSSKNGKGNAGGAGGNKENNKIPFDRKAEKGKSTKERLDALQSPNANTNPALSNEETEEMNSLRAELDNADYNDMYLNPGSYQEKQRRLEELEARRRNEQNVQVQNEQIQSQQTRMRRQNMGEDDDRGIIDWARDSWRGSQIRRNLSNSGVANIGKNIGNTVRTRADGIRDWGEDKKRIIPKPIRNSARGVAKVAGSAARYVGPRAAKYALKGGLAMTGGIIGAAAGLASDDDKNILKYGAAGLGAGWLAGAGAMRVTRGIGSTIDNVAEQAVSTYTAAAKGPEAEEKRQQMAVEKAAMRDKERRKLYSEKLQVKGKQLNQVLEDSQRFRESGVTDDKIILKAMTMEGFGKERTSNERIILAGLASEVGNDNKKIKDLEERLGKRGLSEEDVSKYVKGVRDINNVI